MGEEAQEQMKTESATLKELWTSVSSRSITTQIFPESFDLTGGSSGFTWTLETVPFSSTSRGALLLTGWGSGWSRHRQQKKLERKPLLRGFWVEAEGKGPAGGGASEAKSCRGVGRRKKSALAEHSQLAPHKDHQSFQLANAKDAASTFPKSSIHIPASKPSS